jgi:hypothetical protein
MGIDFSHCDARWSYGNFNRARTRLAAVMGLNLDQMRGFRGSQEWPDAEKFPLVHLLNHSDCDGELTPEQCRVVAPALRKAVEQWPEDDTDRRRFLELADGMDAAAAANEPLEFM